MNWRGGTACGQVYSVRSLTDSSLPILLAYTTTGTDEYTSEAIEDDQIHHVCPSPHLLSFSRTQAF